MTPRQEPSYRVTDEGGLHKFRTEIPNTVAKGQRGQGLSVYAKWLYVYLKSIAGDSRECYQGTRMIAKGAGMSPGQVSAAKLALKKAGLIAITEGSKPNREPDRIRIKDIWAANMQEFMSVHIMNTDMEDDTGTNTGEDSSSVQDMNTNHASVQDMNSGVHNMNSGVHNMNTRRSHEEDPTKKEETPSVSTIVETAPPRTKTAARREKPAGAHRCPPDYEPSPSVRAWADAKYPQINLDDALEAMRDWTFKDARSDWDAVLRTWVRNEAKQHARASPPRRASPTGHQYGLVDKEYRTFMNGKAVVEELDRDDIRGQAALLSGTVCHGRDVF